ncbi:uncharacterized protein LOC143361544 [Halictus rubicundus]|uniref:uncharacterized protein LOC143361544 n=1 Tax=Halictus rubicundus TaxID=77578 RepID=UPI0040374734
MNQSLNFANYRSRYSVRRKLKVAGVRASVEGGETDTPKVEADRRLLLRHERNRRAVPASHSANYQLARTRSHALGHRLRSCSTIAEYNPAARNQPLQLVCDWNTFLSAYVCLNAISDAKYPRETLYSSVQFGFSILIGNYTTVFVNSLIMFTVLHLTKIYDIQFEWINIVTKKELFSTDDIFSNLKSVY